MLIRAYHENDLHAVAEVHIRAFRGFFLSQLHHRVLLQMYRSYAASGMISCVAVTDDTSRLVGFAIGPLGRSQYLIRALLADPIGWVRTAPYLATSVRNFWGVLQRFLSQARPPQQKKVTAPASRDIEAFLLSIAVDPEYAGAGVGKKLLAHWESLASSKGATIVRLETDAVANAATLGFYAKQGYGVQGEISNRGRHLLRLEKILSHHT